MRNTKYAFTLVELIVVITILAILGTIAFISLQGYSADARNSKRTTDLSNIASSLNIKVTTGMNILALAVDNGSILTGGASIGGSTWNTDIAEYKAGAVNYTVLGIKQTDFQDPSDNSDYIGGATILAGWVFQLAASMEGNNGKEAKINGTYNPREIEDVSLEDDSDTGSNIVTLNDSIDIGKFKVGDITDIGTIKKISSDGMNITFKTNSWDAQSTMSLSFDESDGLIQSTIADNAVVDGTENVPY